MSLKSVAAVVAGIVVFSALLFAMEWVTNALFGASGGAAFMRSASTMSLWLVWQGLSLAAGACVTAWLAPRHGLRHALVMGALQALMTAWAMVAVREADSPLWFWLVGIAAMVPAAWLGGSLATASGRGPSRDASRAALTARE